MMHGLVAAKNLPVSCTVLMNGGKKLRCVVVTINGACMETVACRVIYIRLFYMNFFLYL